MAYSGPIPTFQVSSNSIVNNIVGGLVNNAAGAAVNIALSSSLGQQVTNFLGLGTAEAPGNVVSTILSPGLLSTGSQVLTDALTGSILNSQALGPAGPLVAGLATSVVQGLTNQLIQGLAPPPPAEAGNKYFPGLGDEEQANYGESAYSLGEVGSDVVFSIKPAQNTASAQAQDEVTGNASGGVIPEMAFNMKLSTEISGFNIEAGKYLSNGMDVAFTVPYGSVGSGLSSSFLSPSQNALSGFTYLGTQGQTTSSVSAKRLGSAVSSRAFAQESGRVTATASSSGYSSAATAIGEQTINSFLPGTSTATAAATAPVNTDPSSPENLAVAGDYLDFLNEEDDLTNFDEFFGEDPGVEEAEAQKALEGWKFTTTPGDISWETAAKVERANIFGTNKPPVISGSRGMRDLSLSNAMIEGFSLGKSVESKIAKLESLLDYSLTNTYVKVPVYWVTASDKKYGDGNGEGGYFVIKQIKVKEELRDLSGKSTRAVVDVSFSQVPSYQVDDGRDLASKQVAGQKSILGAVADQVDKNIKEQAEKAKALAAANPAALAQQAKQAVAEAEAALKRAQALAEKARQAAGSAPATPPKPAQP